MLASYVTVTLALTVYTASHVAEIVRGSILAVPKGQTEASFAVGLTNFQRYRFVVLPQAARIAIPPTINQYLNFTKNTSLALAVGYAEITFVMVTVIGNANPAPQSIAILMIVYLTFSLVTSLVMNIVNRRLQLATKR
jgi:general L-amino acid transport system permease protein